MTLLPEAGTIGSRLAALGLLAGLLLGAGIFGVVPWIGQIASQRQDLSRLQDRIARAESRMAALEAENATPPDAVPGDLSALTIAAPSATRATAKLVYLAKQAISSANCNVVSLEARPARPAAIGILLEARAKLVCDTPHLQELLHRIETMRPVMLISGLRVRSRAGRAEGGEVLDIEADFSAFLIEEIPPAEVKS